jgi:hypothetical protein
MPVFGTLLPLIHTVKLPALPVVAGSIATFHTVKSRQLFIDTFLYFLASHPSYLTKPRVAKYPVTSSSTGTVLRASTYTIPRRVQNSLADSTNAANVC